ncbi:MAG: SDR family NAD(P)-dependent oxidoreductase [Saprospiraceae bacterium]|nr:SDR family NAD(P)-dependent oxidoreductase [Saprospiraceae bacterium]
MELKTTYGAWACVAGAGEGLGAAFAFGLARRGFNLILIDLDPEKLSEVEAAVRRTHAVQLVSLCVDLVDRESIQPIMAAIESSGCRFLVYNAAYGPVRPFLQNTPDELDRYIQVNMATPMQLAHRFAALHSGRKAGLLLISSLAGWRGTRYVVPYAASKAFTWNLAEGLHYEREGVGLDIGLCTLGPVDTPNYRSFFPRQPLLQPKAMAPQAVAEYALRRFGRRLFLFPGFSTAFSHFLLNRVLPRSWASGLHNAVMKRLWRLNERENSK